MTVPGWVWEFLVLLQLGIAVLWIALRIFTGVMESNNHLWQSGSCMKCGIPYGAILNCGDTPCRGRYEHPR